MEGKDQDFMGGKYKYFIFMHSINYKKNRETQKFSQISSRGVDTTTALGSLFQCLTTFWVIKCFLINNLNFPDTT